MKKNRKPRISEEKEEKLKQMQLENMEKKEVILQNERDSLKKTFDKITDEEGKVSEMSTAIQELDAKIFEVGIENKKLKQTMKKTEFKIDHINQGEYEGKKMRRQQ